MTSRSIASALCLAIAASAATPLRAAAAAPAAAGVTVADAAQRVANEQAAVDAEIGSLQIHIEELEAGGAVDQVEASGIRSEAGAYLKSSAAQLLKKNVDNYNASCVGRVLIGNQSYVCSIARDKLQKLAAGHNQAMAEFRRRLGEQENRLRQIGVEIGSTRDKLQDLQKYASWLELAREKIAKACAGLPTSAGAPKEPRCGHARFDSLRADLPPCEAERCPAWGRP